MATINLHCEDCEAVLGDACLEVHKFLDQYAAYFPIKRFFEYHRSFLHNKYGLILVENKWGEIGRKAAILHLVRDYMEFPIPQNMGWSEKHLAKALVEFNNMYKYEPNMDPRIIAAWKGKGLVAIAFEEG